jgi:hypothetical protein
MNKLWEHLSIADKITLAEIYPEKNKARWKELVLWNLSNWAFDVQKDVKTWITIIIKEWINRQFIKRLYEYFWDKIILDSLDFYVKQWKIKNRTYNLTKQILEQLKKEENV